MIEISDRLRAIAGKIKKGETMADIGTDHGFLPLYLLKKDICPRVIMTDISPMSLAKVRPIAEKYGAGRAECRLGSGIEVLSPGEVDAVVMAGIGGMLMNEIISADPEKAKSFRALILQPRKYPGRLRRFLAENGFCRTDESYVREGRYLCEIITAEPGEDPQDTKNLAYPADHIVWDAPPSLRYSNDPLAGEYVERKLTREKEILKNKGKSESADKDPTLKNIEYLEKMLSDIR